MTYYDIERQDRLSEQPWFNCAKCGKEVRESEWASLCQDCGEQEEAEDVDAGPGFVVDPDFGRVEVDAPFGGFNVGLYIDQD